MDCIKNDVEKSGSMSSVLYINYDSRPPITQAIIFLNFLSLMLKLQSDVLFLVVEVNVCGCR